MHGTITPNPNLTVQDTLTSKGRGVFTKKEYVAGDVVEVSPVLVVRAHWDDLPRDIKSMVYDWGQLLGQRHGQRYAMALGVGSLFNHTAKPNLSYTADAERQALIFTALNDLPAGAELTIDYNEDVAPGEADWFHSMGITPLA